MMKLSVFRIWTIVISILCALIFYQLIVKTYFLEKLCFIDTNSCARIKYQTYQNSVLVNIQPTGYWIWFDGKNILIYGEPIGNICKDFGYEPAYMYDVKNRKVIGYRCATSLNIVKKFYNNVPFNYIFNKNTKNMDVYDVINFLAEKNIININL